MTGEINISRLLQQVGNVILRDSPELPFAERVLAAREGIAPLYRDLLQLYGQKDQIPRFEERNQSAKGTGPTISSAITHSFFALAFRNAPHIITEESGEGVWEDLSGVVFRIDPLSFTDDTFTSLRRQVTTQTSKPHAVTVTYSYTTKIDKHFPETALQRSLTLIPHRSPSHIPQEIIVLLGDTGGYSVLYKDFGGNIAAALAVQRNGRVHHMLPEDLQTVLRELSTL